MQPIEPIRTRWVPVLWAMFRRELYLLAYWNDGRYDGYAYQGGKKPRRVITEVSTLSGKTFYSRDLVEEIN